MADDLTAGGVPVYRDSVGVVRERKGQAQIDSLAEQMAGKADASAIPQPATTTPKTEMTGGAVGAQPTRYAREDHQHPRLTSTTYATLASDGTASVSFTRPFTNKPGITMTETDVAGKQPLICSVQSWVRETMTPAPAGAYIGCVIKGQRAQVLPTINPLSGVLTLLTAVVSGVNAIVGQLTNYNVFGGTVDGAVVSIIAVARSDVPAT